MRVQRLTPFALVFLLCACGPESTENGNGSGNGEENGENGALCTEPDLPPCDDEIIQELNLQTTIAPGTIANTTEDDGFATHVDATAGGFGADPPDAYVYARFTDTGLEKVDISDEDALESMEWDIAFRRYVIRVNSEASGASCVNAARTAPATDYDSLTGVPDGLTYHGDAFYSASCDLITDGALPGSPATVLSSYYSYPGCVKMTGNVYVLRLASGRHLKLTVTAYYDPAGQEICDTDETVPPAPTGAGNIRLRWAFLD